MNDTLTVGLKVSRLRDRLINLVSVVRSIPD